MSVTELPLTRESRRVQELEVELRLREREIRMLKMTADAISSQLNLEKVLQLVAERAGELTQAQTTLIPILNPESTEYTYRAGSGEGVDEIIGESLPRDYGVCGWIWQHKKPWWSGVLQELSAEERSHWEHEMGSTIMVPLVGKHQFLGGIACQNKIGGGLFGERDLDLLTLFASQVAVAIDNATAFEQLEKEKLRAEAFQEELRVVNQELLATNSDLEHMALFDSLTGLANRHLIQERLQQGIYVARREKSSVAILMVDLDRFKEVNDTLGHHVGDKLLKEVGIRLQKALREADTIGRLGGDEFAVVMPGADVEEAGKVARRLQKTLRDSFDLQEGTFMVSASMGLAVYPENGVDVGTLLKRADIAMYEAKQNYEGVSVYNPESDQNTPGRLSLLADLHQALDLEQLELFYQPKLDLRSQAIVGVEALMRWHHPEHGLVPPDIFIPILEQSGLLKRYTYWALDTAAAQCRAWNDQGWDLSIAVNLSMYNLRDAGLSPYVQDCVQNRGLHAHALVLEVTESAVMSDPHHVSRVLDELVASGIQFSIDDFGTGHSSLSHLKRLSVAELKIDKSFVFDMVGDNDDSIIVRSTVDLAHNMGLRVVAEGVENEGSLAMLRGMGCDQVQGYFIAKPMPVECFGDWLRASSWEVKSLTVTGSS
ncbi:MAG: bifunctional diguanylate cyclase/phosphodiesterase [Gammaproteobacteria bacterium]